MFIELTPEKHQEHIDELYELINALNAELPTVEGNGDLASALNYLQLELASTILHAQRTFVLTAAIIEFLQNAEQEIKRASSFVKAGENFNGTAAPIN